MFALSTPCYKFLIGLKDDEMSESGPKQLSYQSHLVLLCVWWWSRQEEWSGVRAAGGVLSQQSQPCGTSDWEVAGPALALHSPSSGGKGRTCKWVLKPFFISVCFLTVATQASRRKMFDSAKLLSLDVLRLPAQSVHQQSQWSIHQRCVYILNTYTWVKLKIAFCWGLHGTNLGVAAFCLFSESVVLAQSPSVREVK